MLQLLHNFGNRQHIALIHKQKPTLSYSASMSWSSKQFLILLAKGTKHIVLALKNHMHLIMYHRAVIIYQPTFTSKIGFTSM
jgi:hypothetical protein